MSAHDADEAIFSLKETGNIKKVPNQPYNSEYLLQSLIENASNYWLEIKLILISQCVGC